MKINRYENPGSATAFSYTPTRLSSHLRVWNHVSIPNSKGLCKKDKQVLACHKNYKGREKKKKEVKDKWKNKKVPRRKTPWKFCEMERNQKLCNMSCSALKLCKLRRDSLTHHT